MNWIQVIALGIQLIIELIRIRKKPSARPLLKELQRGLKKRDPAAVERATGKLLNLRKPPGSR